MMYDAEFPDSSVRHYGANIIAQNLYSQTDLSGHSHKALKQILDFKKDNTTIEKGDKFLNSKMGKQRQRESTIG